MGYAILNYPNNGTMFTTTILHDIVGCVTGQFSSSAQLRGANTGSDIINTLGQNWSIAYPTASYNPSTPNVNLASWVLTAPCVDPTKTKFVRLTNYAARTTTGVPTYLAVSGSGVGNLYTNTDTGSPSPVGILLQACTSASSALNLVNQTYFSPRSDQNRHAMLSGTTIIVSWSSRHIAIWSNGCALYNVNIVQAYLEFPETDMTLAKQLLPAYYLIERNGNLNVAFDGTGFVYASQGAIARAGDEASGDIWAPDFFNVATNARVTASLGGVSTSFDLLVSNYTTPKPVNTIPTVDQFGNNTRMLTPLIVNTMSKGQPSVNLSRLTNMYMVANGLGAGGNLFSGSSGVYAYLPSNTGISFAVKRE